MILATLATMTAATVLVAAIFTLTRRRVDDLGPLSSRWIADHRD